MKHALAALALLTATAAHAEPDWRLVSDGFYIDAASIEKTGSSVWLWLADLNATSRPMQLMKFQCGIRFYDLIEQVAFDKTGKAVRSRDAMSLGAYAVIPGSIDERTMEIACGTRPMPTVRPVPPEPVKPAVARPAKST